MSLVPIIFLVLAGRPCCKANFIFRGWSHLERSWSWPDSGILVNYFLSFFFLTGFISDAMQFFSIVWENWESQDTRKLIDFFIILAKPPSLLLRRFVLRKVGASDWWWTARDHGRSTDCRRSTSRPLSPSRLPFRAHFHRERDALVRGRKHPF